MLTNLFCVNDEFTKQIVIFRGENAAYKFIEAILKFTGAAHWSCNINLQLTKKVPVIFHNLRGYDIHLIFLWA